MRTSTTLRVPLALFAAALSGCATSKQVKEDPPAPGPSAEAAAPRTAATPDEIEAIDEFFRQTSQHLQFECYDSEADRTHLKYEGNVSVSLVVLPGGKASQVKLLGTTLVSTDSSKTPGTGIVDCVLENVRSWEWPKVENPAQYMGSINFKPAW